MTVLLVLHIIIVVTMIFLILIQRSSSDGFTGGGSSGGSGLMSGRGKANFLTRSTAVLATAFLVNSLVLAYISSHTETNASIIDSAIVKEVLIPEEKNEEKPSVPIVE